MRKGRVEEEGAISIGNTENLLGTFGELINGGAASLVTGGVAVSDAGLFRGNK